MSSEQSFLISEGMKRHWQQRKHYSCTNCNHLSSFHTDVYINFETGNMDFGLGENGHGCNVKNCDCDEYQHSDLFTITHNKKSECGSKPILADCSIGKCPCNHPDHCGCNCHDNLLKSRGKQ